MSSPALRPARLWLLSLGCAAALVAAQQATAASPVVPGSLPYQGLLLDGLGQPRTGSVDLTVRIYDAVFGGTLVYKQSFPSVALSDGVFSVQLGPAGEGSDAPANPLSTDLGVALGGDAGSTSPVRFLEVTVGSDGPLARTQILSSAYALRAASAATADSATTAQTADDVASVGGVAAAYLTQFFQYVDADGSAPPNYDPREGLADVDGDGLANFVDSDNDGDGLSDFSELQANSDINLVTPRITSVSPTKIFFDSTATVAVQGTGFQPGLSVAFGTQTPVPTSVTPTSFHVLVGPQPPNVVGVTVTNANGEFHTRSGLVDFTAVLAHTISLSANRATLAYDSGTGAVVLGGIQEYGVGVAAEAEFPLGSAGAVGQIGMTFDPGGNVAGLRCRSTGATCDLEILVDSNADRALEDETGILVETLIGGGNPSLQAADLATDPAGRWVAGYVRRKFGPDAVVAHDRNGDGDFADANEIVLVAAAIGGTSNPIPADLAVDSNGRVAYVYERPSSGTAIYVAYDRSGDGDYADTVAGNPELSILASGTLANCLATTFDAAGHLAVVYGNASGLTLARDNNGDGDFVDSGETTAIVSGTAASACDVAYRAGQPFAVLYHRSGTGMHLLLDKNDDGDFADEGEDQTLPATLNSGAEGVMVLNGSDRAIIAAPPGTIIHAVTN
jgi:hypothetical protein